jgi:small subunit ribosomal protein S8
MDTIGDFLTKIRNAQATFKESVEVPYSKMKFEIAKILKKENFIEEVIKKRAGGKTIIKIILKYNEKRPAISGLKRISKPSRRIYCSYKELRPVKQGSGISIISTSKGVMTNKEARRKKLGGELICEVF